MNIKKKDKECRRQNGFLPSNNIFAAWVSAREKVDALGRWPMVNGKRMPTDAQAKAQKDADELMSECMLMMRAGRLETAPLHDVLHKSSTVRQISDMIRDNSLIPVEIAIWGILALTGHYLCLKGITLELDHDDIGGENSVKPNLWALIFAPSGAGKSKMMRYLIRRLELEMGGSQAMSYLPQPDSAAAVRDNMLAAQAPLLAFWDEVGRLYGDAQGKSSNNTGLRKVMLQAHDGVVSRSLAGGKNAQSNICLSLIGVTVTETMNDDFMPADWKSGLLARHNMVAAAPVLRPTDPLEYGRRLRVSTVLKKLHKSGVVNQWASDLVGYKLHDHYTITEEAEAYGDRRIGLLVQALGTNDSFALRYMYTGYKLALILHVLYRRAGSVIDKEDMANAFDIIEVSLRDLKHLSSEGESQETCRLLDLAEKAYVALPDKSIFSYTWLSQYPLSKKCEPTMVRFIYDAMQQAIGKGMLPSTDAATEDAENEKKVINFPMPEHRAPKEKSPAPVSYKSSAELTPEPELVGEVKSFGYVEKPSVLKEEWPDGMPFL